MHYIILREPWLDQRFFFQFWICGALEEYHDWTTFGHRGLYKSVVFYSLHPWELRTFSHPNSSYIFIYTLVYIIYSNIHVQYFGILSLLNWVAYFHWQVSSRVCRFHHQKCCRRGASSKKRSVCSHLSLQFKERKCGFFPDCTGRVDHCIDQ